MNKPITVRCSGANFYLLDCQGGKLLLDAGWPQCLPMLKAQIKECGLKLCEIRCVIATHAHPDHAGLVQTLKQLCGTQLVIHEKQIPYLDELNAFFARKKDANFEPIRVDYGDLVLGGDNRAVLRSIGILGELLETPGHSDDSVSLVLDTGEAFTGDLTRPDLATEEHSAAVTTSWKKILERGVDWIYPGHGGPIAASEIAHLLTTGE